MRSKKWLPPTDKLLQQGKQPPEEAVTAVILYQVRQIMRMQTLQLSPVHFFPLCCHSSLNCQESVSLPASASTHGQQQTNEQDNAGQEPGNSQRRDKLWQLCNCIINVLEPNVAPSLRVQWRSGCAQIKIKYINIAHIVFTLDPVFACFCVQGTNDDNNALEIGPTLQTAATILVAMS